MAKVTLEQENGDIAMALQNLWTMKGTKLAKVCREHGLDYKNTYNAIHAKNVSLEFLKDIINKIDPKAKLKVDGSITLEVGGKEIFKQKNK